MVSPTAPTTLDAIPGSGQITLQGFALPEGVTPAAPARQVLSWQPQGAEVLGQIKWLLNQQGLQLPVRSLSHQAERCIPGLQRLNAHMGTAHGDRTGELAWSTELDPNRLREGVTTMMERWITDVLDEIVEQGDDDALRQAVRDLRALHARGALVALQTRLGKVYSWGVQPNGTARPGSQESYPALADAAADALHGQELVPGYGVMRRVIPRHAQGRAELIGEPVHGAQGGRVSLVVNVRVLSLPGLSRPLVALTPYLRCWATAPAPAWAGAVVGYVLDGDATRPARAFVLSAEAWSQGVGGSIERAHGLDRHADIRLQCGDRARVLLQQRGSDGRLVTAIVPEHDRMAALRGAAAPLAPLGLVPWTGVREVTAPTPSSAAGMVLGFTALPLGPSGQGGWVALAFRVCLRSGQVEARAACSQGSAPSSLGLTPWEPLSQTLTRLAGASPLVLNATAQQAQYQAFIAQTVQAELEEGRTPLVTVDSTHAVRLWPWLADCRIDPQRIEFAQLGQRKLQEAWQRAGVRLVRIRQQNAPSVGSSQRGTARLLQVQDTTIPTYLACGPTPGPSTHAPHPVELSVLLTQPGDDTDQLAGFVARLIGGRRGPGGGPVLPTPLCLKRLMRG